MMRPVNRIEPAAAPGAYQTYQVVTGADRALLVACSQVGCEAWAHGWETAVDESTDLGRQQAAYIRQQAGRTFREQRTDAGLTVFSFDSRQRCFAEHRTRPETYLVRGGDWRQDFGVLRRHTSGRDWVEDFGEHQQRVADQHRKG